MNLFSSHAQEMAHMRVFLAANVLALAVAVCRMRDHCSLELLSAEDYPGGVITDSCGSVWEMNDSCKRRFIRNGERCYIKDPCTRKFSWASRGHYVGIKCKKVHLVNPSCHTVRVLHGDRCRMWDTCARSIIWVRRADIYHTRCGETIQTDEYCRFKKIRFANRCMIRDPCNNAIIWEDIGRSLWNECGDMYRIDAKCTPYEVYYDDDDF